MQPVPGLCALSEQEFSNLSKLFYDQIGLNLGPQKRVLVASRLSKRLRHLGLQSFAEYHTYLTSGAGRETELKEAINCVTTHKTDFFREEEHFTILTEFLAGRRLAPGMIRLWSAACSTGEEPYTMAIALLEAFGTPANSAEILATDIDTNVISSAAQGVYAEDRLSDVPVAVRKKYFLRGVGAQAGFVQIKPDVRRMVRFGRLNLAGDHWQVPKGLNAIFCRNVMIYFDRLVQEKLVRGLLSYLEPEGLLFVGRSESLYWLSSILEPVSQGVYRERKSRS